jgi:RimJ/RimL family protein N-acetyltransferase
MFIEQARHRDMWITLAPVTPAELCELAESRTPLAMVGTALEGAPPPAFAARRSRDQLAAGKPACWGTVYAMVRVADGKLVGSCGFKDVPVNGRVEIGYGVAPAGRNAGVASAAVAALLDMAFASGAVREVAGPGRPREPALHPCRREAGFPRRRRQDRRGPRRSGPWLATRRADR